MPAYRNLTGERFTRLTVTARAGSISEDGGKRVRAVWVCVCECGKTRTATTTELTSGHVKSCGCMRAEGRQIIHGGARAGAHFPEYEIWIRMRQRCNNPNDPKYPSYGGRGISVCDRWSDFANFITDMGRRPDPRLSVDRINNNGNYEPGNCRWATAREQRMNQRRMEVAA